MITQLSEVFRLIKLVNARLIPPVISEVELREEEDNLHDIPELLESVSSLVSTIVEKLGRPGTDVTEDMIHLRLKITDMIWHIDQIDELLMKVIHPEGPADDDHQETEFA